MDFHKLLESVPCALLLDEASVASRFVDAVHAMANAVLDGGGYGHDVCNTHGVLPVSVMEDLVQACAWRGWKLAYQQSTTYTWMRLDPLTRQQLDAMGQKKEEGDVK